MKNKTLTEVQLWKDNKLDQEYQMPIEEFREKFFAWLKTKEKSWCEYYGSRVAVCEFIGTELKSVANCDFEKQIDDYTILSEMIREGFWDIVEKMEPAVR